MTRDDTLEADLAAALAARADVVAPGPMPAARAAVARRLRYRRRRRVVVTGVAVVLGLGLGFASGVGEETGPPDVVSSGRAPVGAADVAPGDDPATVGLPRVALDPGAVGRPRIDDDPLVQLGAAPTDPDATDGLDLLQVFRAPDALLPAVFVPWGTDGRGFDLPVVGIPEDIEVGGAPATWTGEERGWSRLTWALPGGTPAQLYAYSIDREELVAMALGLQPRVAGPGFDADVLPPGFVGRDVVAGPGDAGSPATAPCYVHRYEGDGLVVGVTVWAESDLDREVALTRELAGALAAEAVDVGGRPGVLVMHPEGGWSLGWSPAEGATAALGLHGPDITRSAVLDLAAVVQTPDAEAWADLVEEGREP